LEYRGPGPSSFLKEELEQESGLGFSTATLIVVGIPVSHSFLNRWLFSAWK